MYAVYIFVASFYGRSEFHSKMMMMDLNKPHIEIEKDRQNSCAQIKPRTLAHAIHKLTNYLVSRS